MSAEDLYQRFQEMLEGELPDLPEIEQLERKAVTELGAGDRFTLQVASYLATVMSAYGRAEEALATFDDVIARATQNVPGGPEAIFVKEQKAAVLENLGRSGEAVDLLREALAGWRRLSKRADDRALECQLRLAEALMHAGNPEEAESNLTELLAVLDDVLGPEHPLTLAALKLRVQALFAQATPESGEHHDASEDRFDDAVRAARKHLARLAHFKGQQDPETQEVRSELAFALAFYDDAERALPALEALVADAEKKLGEQDVQTLFLREHLGILLGRAGRPQEGHMMLNAVIDGYEEAEQTALLMRALNGRTMMLQGIPETDADPDGIVVAIRDQITRLTQALGEDHEAVTAARRGLAMTLAQQGRDEEAEAVFNESSFTDPLHRLRLRHDLLMGSDRVEEAEEAYDQLLVETPLDRADEQVREALSEAALAPCEAVTVSPTRRVDPESHHRAYRRLQKLSAAYTDSPAVEDPERLVIRLFAADELRHAQDFDAACAELEQLLAESRELLGDEDALTQEIDQALAAAEARIAL